MQPHPSRLRNISGRPRPCPSVQNDCNAWVFESYSCSFWPSNSCLIFGWVSLGDVCYQVGAHQVVVHTDPSSSSSSKWVLQGRWALGRQVNRHPSGPVPVSGYLEGNRLADDKKQTPTLIQTVYEPGEWVSVQMVLGKSSERVCLHRTSYRHRIKRGFRRPWPPRIIWPKRSIVQPYWAS